MPFGEIRYEVADVSAFLEKRPARFLLRPSADLPPFYPWWQARPFPPSRD